MEHFDFSNVKTWAVYITGLILGFSIEQLTKVGGLIAIWVTVIGGVVGIYMTILKIIKLRNEIEEQEDSENE